MKFRFFIFYLVILYDFVSIGTDEQFTHKLGADVLYSEDNQYYRIVGRYDIRGRGCVYLLNACDVTNPIQEFELMKKMKVINCQRLSYSNSILLEFF